MKFAVITGSFGGIDKISTHEAQTIPYDYHLFTEENFPLRSKAMTPRLQAKIPKMFGWQLAPGYDYYLWADGNIKLAKPDTLEYFYKQTEDHDITVIRHHRRPNIRQEVRYLRKGLRQQSIYLVNRYENELWAEQYKAIQKDKDYVDDLLVLGGIFMYRNTPQVQGMFKEWWYQVTRYNVQDQISFAYVLKKANLKIKVLDHDCTRWDMINLQRHYNNQK